MYATEVGNLFVKPHPYMKMTEGRRFSLAPHLVRVGACGLSAGAVQERERRRRDWFARHYVLTSVARCATLRQSRSVKESTRTALTMITTK
jgi:hypothetical protein